VSLRLALGAMFAIATLVCETPAEAQRSAEVQTASATQRARARALFHEGVAFAREGRWTQAVDRFSRTLELTPSPVVAYNLASALEAVGRIVEACEHLRSVERFETVDETLAGEARALLATMQPRIARLVLEVEPADAQVELDGQPVMRAELGVEIPVDPGGHRISVRLASGQTHERSIELGAGEHRRVDFGPEIVRTEIVVHDRVGPEQAAELEPVSLDLDEPTVFETWWFWTATAAVVAGAVLAIVFLTTSSEADPVQGDLDQPVLRGVVTP
jgi:hypothetical protein